MILRWLRRLALAGILGWVAVVVLLFTIQRRLLYPARDPVRPWGSVITTSAGLPAIVIPGSPSIVWFHGNGQRIGQIHYVQKLGTGVVLPEYPGYGGAPGDPTEDSILAAARAAIATLPTPPVCVGYSLGTGPAAAMAAEGRCARLVLLAPYTSMADEAEFQYPFVFARWLVLDRWDTVSRAPAIHVPTLVIQGDQDAVVPPRMGPAVAAAIAGARMHVIPGAGHGLADDAPVLAEVAAFARGE